MPPPLRSGRPSTGSLVIDVLWFVIVASDRIHVWLRADHRDRQIRREVRHYLAGATPAEGRGYRWG